MWFEDKTKLDPAVIRFGDTLFETATHNMSGFL